MLALLVFAGKKKLLKAKGPFGANVFKNPAGHICMYIYIYIYFFFMYI